MSNAAILDSFSDVDILSNPPMVQVPAGKLREGMVILDPMLGCPVAGVDHRNPSPRNSGMVNWFVADLENGGWKEILLRPDVIMDVMAV